MATTIWNSVQIFVSFRGADANKNANSDDIEMKTNLVDNKGDPTNYGEETGPWRDTLHLEDV